MNPKFSNHVTNTNLYEYNCDEEGYTVIYQRAEPLLKTVDSKE